MNRRKGRHVVFSLNAHIVFVPGCHGRVFDADAIERLRRIFRVVCADFETDLIEFTGEPGYIYLLVNYPPKIRLSGLINSLKGVSARRLRGERSDLAKKYWIGGLWSASYFAGSATGDSASIMRKYIKEHGSTD